MGNESEASVSGRCFVYDQIKNEIQDELKNEIKALRSAITCIQDELMNIKTERIVYVRDYIHYSQGR